MAAACRKSGIKEFKGFGFEFTLGDNFNSASGKSSKSLNKKIIDSQNSDDIPTNAPSREDLLMWSVSTGAQAEDSLFPQGDQ